MIMGINCTHLVSVWNPSGPSEVPQTSNWSGTIFCRFLQQTGSNLELKLQKNPVNNLFVYVF